MIKLIVKHNEDGEKDQTVLIHKAKFMENGGNAFVRIDFTLNPDRDCERLVAIVSRSGGKTLPSEHLTTKLSKMLDQVVYVIDPLRAGRQKRTPKFAPAVLLGAVLATDEGGWIMSERLGGLIVIDEFQTLTTWATDFEDDFRARVADDGDDLLEDSTEDDDEESES